MGRKRIAEADFLKTCAGLETRGRQAQPGAVGLDVAPEAGRGVAGEKGRAVGVDRDLGIDRDGARRAACAGGRERELGDGAEGEEGSEGRVEAG
jgi:hypothetical protein